MQSNNFLNKTVKTFLTSLMVSVFVFGSFYFLLSDNSGSSNNKPSGDVKSDTSKKLVVSDDSSTYDEKENIKSTKVSRDETAVSKSVETDRNVLGAKTTNLVAQLPTDLSPFVNQTTSTTPAAIIAATIPATALTTTDVATPAAPIVASGVPKTGNESLYILLGIFSIVTGYLISNGKSLAINSFEKEI